MASETRRTLSLTGLFAAFVFLQFTTLWMGNHAGEGYLSLRRREEVYYVIQVFVILGFLLYAGVRTAADRKRARRNLIVGALGLYAAGTAVLLAGAGPRAALIAVVPATLCLGCLGGAVYERMSWASALGCPVARSMGLGSSLAVALQYLLQLRWNLPPLLAAVMLTAFLLLARLLLREERPGETPSPDGRGIAPRAVLFPCLIAATLLLFISFYNGYIHHLQIQSGYTDFNVYTWPRLMTIPCYLLFAVIGDRRQGRLVPVTALCITLAALLNSVLTGITGAYWLNMCLFYCALAAVVSYYDLTFWRLAPKTRRPALWAPMGRVLDSALVLLAAVFRLSDLPAVWVLTLDIAGLVLVIVLMALSGDFTLAAPVPSPHVPDGEADFSRLAARYGLTPAETRVLRELVLTEDKQAAIADRLGIKVGTVQYHTTSLYRKTGAATRAGLWELCRRIDGEEP